MYKDSSDLLSVVLEETGGLGVDIVIDSGGKHIYACLIVCLNRTVNTDEHQIFQLALRLLEINPN